jgi:ribosomal protein L40E
MAKFPEAEARLFKNKFVCRVCKTVTKANNMKVIAGKVKCKKCDSKALRVKRKK